MQGEVVKEKIPFVKKLQKIVRSDEFVALIPLVVLLVVVQIVNQNYLSWQNLSSLLNLIPYTAICCLGNALVIMTGSADISVGKTAGLSCMVFGWLIKSAGLPGWVAIIGGLAVGVLIGWINSLFIFNLNLPSFIVTLGMSYVIGSCRYFLSAGYPYTELGEGLKAFGNATFLDLNYAFYICVALYIVVSIMLAKTTFGRKIKAVGDNSEVAALSGINVVKIKKFSRLVCGLIVASAGILLAINQDYAAPTTGTGWEFTCMAACAIGGVSLSGGKGSGVCIALGMLTMMFLNNAVIMLGIDSKLSGMFTGLFLMAAASLDMIKSRRKINAEAIDEDVEEELSAA